MQEPQAGPTGTGATQTARLFPMRLLGFGLYLAWNAVVSSFEQTFDVAALSSPLFRLYFGTILSAGLLLVAAIVLPRRADRRPWGTRAIGVCLAGSVLFGVLDLVGVASGLVVFDLCALVCKSVAGAGLFLMWNVRLAQFKPRVAWVAYAGSMATASVVYLLVATSNTVTIALATFVLPVASCILLASCRSLPSDESSVTETATWSIPWRPVVLIAAFSFAQHLVGHYGGNVLVADEVGRLVAAVAVLVPLLAAFDRFDINLIARLCPALVVAALALCGVHGLADGFGWSKLLACVGSFGFTLYLYLMLNTLCFRWGMRAERLFGIVEATNIVAALPGAALGNHLQALEMTGAYLPIDVAMGATSVAIVLLSMLLITSRHTDGTWGMQVVGPAGDAGAGWGGAGGANGAHAGGAGAEARAGGAGASGTGASGTHAGGARFPAPGPGSDYLRDHVQRCTQVARHFGLTHREEEVLALLAEGKSFQEVESALCIAHGTMRVHVQHIYNKLDAHSSEEARAVVASWRVS